VPVNDEEIRLISAFLGMPEADFIAQFTDLRRNRSGLTLIDKPDGACIFLEGENHCVINEVKPKQCRAFPNGWNFSGWREVCEAVEMTNDEIPKECRKTKPEIPP
jgi:Fe-S-cluster containining protein